MKKDGIINHLAWRLRFLTLFINLVVLSFIFIFWEVREYPSCFGKFTNWTLLMTLAQQLLVIKAASDVDVHKKHGLLAAVHITFECSLIMNIITVVVYWGVLHTVELKKQINPYRKMQLYNVHIFPALCLLINYIWLDIRLSWGHHRSLIGGALVYGVLNFYQTKSQGKPVYHFLDWKDHQSFLIYVGLIIVFIFVYYILVKLSYLIKPTKKTAQIRSAK